MNSALPPYTHFWRANKLRPERANKLCRIVSRPSQRVVVVEFRDGCKLTCLTSHLRSIPRQVLA